MSIGVDGDYSPERLLGINCDPHAAFLAVVQGGVIVAGMPERMKPPEGLDLSSRLLEFINEVRRVLGEVSPVRVGLLLPESGGQFQPAYSSISSRVTIETLVRVAVAQEGLPLDQLARPTVRSRLGLPRSGGLDSHVATAAGAPVGKYWTTGRGLAALTAMAVEVGDAPSR